MTSGLDPLMRSSVQVTGSAFPLRRSDPVPVRKLGRPRKVRAKRSRSAAREHCGADSLIIHVMARLSLYGANAYRSELGMKRPYASRLLFGCAAVMVLSL